ncbi:hypothetical protein FXV91_04425 [Methanosarcina sp. DH2]|uniref:hypothetical protein n=1 Tax=Methanosarcina sp. DH2 TaxID=2605639 RepID=UPI001E3A84F5|nr:hypothetical protein [Methanosarcina sp. DH2]MCC4769467.1 hypothetical protein [Methanosarcina sp. DH2]
MQNETEILKELLNNVVRMDFETDQGLLSVVKYNSHGVNNWTVCNSEGYLNKTDYVDKDECAMIPESLISDNDMFSLNEALDFIMGILTKHKIN